MFAGRPAESLHRCSIVGVPVTGAAIERQDEGRKRSHKEETTMRGPAFVVCCGLLASVFFFGPQAAMAQEKSGKNCRLEQQCHWENFKKICVWVKVCR